MRNWRALATLSAVLALAAGGLAIAGCGGSDDSSTQTIENAAATSGGEGDAMKHEGAMKDESGDSMKHEGAMHDDSGGAMKHEGAMKDDSGSAMKHEGAMKHEDAMKEEG